MSQQVRTEEQKLAWLGRRVGMGLPDGLPEQATLTAEAILEMWIDPDGSELASIASPFAAFAPPFIPDRRAQAGIELAEAWLDFLHDTPRPLEANMMMFWHDHFAVSYPVVNQLGLVTQHLETLRTNALGNFRDLLYAVAIDPAMLFFLDGRTSTFRVPNENFGRELLELYSVGIGVFDEADVQAAAAAATGWQVVKDTGQARFVEARHESAEQTVLGVSGVRDMEGLIDAVANHPACAPFIVGKICDWFLGTRPEPADFDRLTALFVAENLELAPVVREILLLGLAGQAVAQPQLPAFWMTAVRKATGARPEPGVAIPILESAGMVPAYPPNVGGFPPPPAYLSASSVVARFSGASIMVDGAPGSKALRLARDLDLDGLARHLGLIEGFVGATKAALRQVHEANPAAPGRATLTLALASPELAVV